MKFRQWDVHRIQHTFFNPDGAVKETKPKYFIVFAPHEKSIRCFMVSTRMSPAIRNRLYLHVCGVELRSVVDRFFTHDCYADLTKVWQKPPSDFSRESYQGKLSDVSIAEIAAAYPECPIADKLYLKYLDEGVADIEIV